jgi:hypothetical protein
MIIIHNTASTSSTATTLYNCTQSQEMNTFSTLKKATTDSSMKTDKLILS